MNLLRHPRSYRGLHRWWTHTVRAAGPLAQTASLASPMSGGRCPPRLLPARLGHAGDLADMGKPAKADAAHAELPDIAARPAAELAAIALPRGVFRRTGRLDNLANLRHWGTPSSC